MERVAHEESEWVHRDESVEVDSSLEGLIARARSEGFVIWNAGSVGAWNTEALVTLFTDQVCADCHHVPCPCCGAFCDHSECIFGEEDHSCTYESPPRFFRADGREWDGAVGE